MSPNLCLLLFNWPNSVQIFDQFLRRKTVILQQDMRISKICRILNELFHSNDGKFEGFIFIGPLALGNCRRRLFLTFGTWDLCCSSVRNMFPCPPACATSVLNIRLDLNFYRIVQIDD